MANENRDKTRLPLLGKHTSLWIDTSPTTSFPELIDELSVDVAIIGGGIAGLTCAHLLKNEGKKVAVIESDRIVMDVTGHTTAKVTAAHGLIYKYLIDKFGKEEARLYAEANLSAIDHIENLIKKLNISCEFARTEAYTYTTDLNTVSEIKDEVEAAKSLGLPVSYTEEARIPFKIAAAIRYENQAYFHPRKYLIGVAKDIIDSGSYIFEETRALDVVEPEDGEECMVKTNHGTLKAKNVIVATNFPIYDPLMLFAKMAPMRSYVLGVRTNEPAVSGMYYADEEPISTIRNHPYSNTEDIIILGGQQHKAGHGGDVNERYRILEEWAYKNLNVKSIEYRWSTQDNYPIDRVPFIGKVSDRVYTATGFKGWGMTHSMVAGILITDQIMGRPNPWEKLYDPKRFKALAGGKDFLQQNIEVAKDLISGYIQNVPEEDLEEIEPGEGKLINYKDKKVGVYKDEEGKVYCVKPNCTHMGCVLSWNNGEKTWDCPCHGSRFNYDGTVIHAPAKYDLQGGQCQEIKNQTLTHSGV